MEEEKKGGVCRVCLSTVKKKSMSLFQKYKDSLVFNHINAIANVEISEGDGLPDKICSHCLLELETTIHFKQKCESSNIILQTTILNPPENDDIDVKLIKKEEPPEDIEFFDDAGNFFDSTLFEDEDKKLKSEQDLNQVELGLRKSRAIDLQLQCDDCGGFFKSKCKLRVHWKKVHLKQALFCLICKRRFKSYKAFNRHQQDKRKSCVAASNFRIEGEGKNRVFYCKECEYKSLRIKDVMTHLVVHTGDRPWKCDLCPKTCTQQSSLQAHKESAHKEFKVELTCHYCGKLVKGRNRIYRHLKVHTEKGIPCTVCHKILKNRNSLSQHMHRHTGVKSYTCEKCASTFYTSSELANHKRTVHNKGKYWYKCDLCDYKSMRSEMAKKHKARHTESNVPCTVCGMFFDSTQKLLLHQRRHYEEKKYPCPHCDVKFYRRDSVGKHIRAKHRVALTQRPIGFSVKQESVAMSKYDDVIEIELSPQNAS